MYIVPTSHRALCDGVVFHSMSLEFGCLCKIINAQFIWWCSVDVFIDFLFRRNFKTKALIVNMFEINILWVCFIQKLLSITIQKLVNILKSQNKTKTHKLEGFRILVSMIHTICWFSIKWWCYYITRNTNLYIWLSLLLNRMFVFQCSSVHIATLFVNSLLSFVCPRTFKRFICSQLLLTNWLQLLTIEHLGGFQIINKKNDRLLFENP